MTINDFQSKIAQIVPKHGEKVSEEVKEETKNRLHSLLLGMTMLSNDVGLNLEDIAKQVVIDVENFENSFESFESKENHANL